jgi:MFS family permease
MAGEAARPRTGELIVTGVPAEPGLAVGMSEEARGAFSPRPALVLLCALLVIDFASRQFVVTAFPYLWAEFAASEVQLGALVSAVSVVVALGAFPIALTVDRWSRVREIAVRCGAVRRPRARSRIGIGVGQAGFGPAGSALLRATFPPERWSTVLAVLAWPLVSRSAGGLGPTGGTGRGSCSRRRCPEVAARRSVPRQGSRGER